MLQRDFNILWLQPLHPEMLVQPRRTSEPVQKALGCFRMEFMVQDGIYDVKPCDHEPTQSTEKTLVSTPLLRTAYMPIGSAKITWSDVKNSVLIQRCNKHELSRPVLMLAVAQPSPRKCFNSVGENLNAYICALYMYSYIYVYLISTYTEVDARYLNGNFCFISIYFLSKVSISYNLYIKISEIIITLFFYNNIIIKTSRYIYIILHLNKHFKWKFK